MSVWPLRGPCPFPSKRVREGGSVCGLLVSCVLSCCAAVAFNWGGVRAGDAGALRCMRAWLFSSVCAFTAGAVAFLGLW